MKKGGRGGRLGGDGEGGGGGGGWGEWGWGGGEEGGGKLGDCRHSSYCSPSYINHFSKGMRSEIF